MRSNLIRYLGSALLALTLLLVGPVQAQEADYGEKDIVETVIGAGNFTTFVAALEAAGLVDTLKAEGPFTVFAPTDAAFERLPEGTLEELLMPENQARLVEVLQYHVVPATLVSAAAAMDTEDLENLSDAEYLQTLHGARVTVSDAQAGFLIEDAAIVEPDISAANGVIHAIDKVLLPPAEDDQ